jgi:hypothetical protein
LFTSSFSHAAIFEISITGLPDPSGIEGFTLWFDVSDNFTFNNFQLGDAVPTSGVLGWDLDNDPPIITDDPTNGGVLKIGAFDQDGLFLGVQHNLENGLIASFEYNGDILDLALIQFSDDAGNNLYPDLVRLVSFDPKSGAEFAYVPIPAAAILLATGLLGLVGLRRLKK